MSLLLPIHNPKNFNNYGINTLRQGESGTFYHATSKNNWEKIRKEGILYGISYNGKRYTYLTPEYDSAINWAGHGINTVLLEVDYTPVGRKYGNADDFQFEDEIPKGNTVIQFRVNIPIPLDRVRLVAEAVQSRPGFCELNWIKT